MRLFIGCSSSDSLDSEIVSDCRKLVEDIASIPGVFSNIAKIHIGQCLI